MASDEDRCTNYPDFAIICSFIENFDDKVKLTFPDIDELQILLEDTDNVNPLLAKLIGQLLRRINKSVKFDKWERGLQRFAHSYSHQDGWELERFGFKKAKLECKIRVFRNLLESQFDLYKSFKDKVNLISAKDLRLQPCGRDKHGVSYWCQLDKFANLRIYKDDQDDETWTLVARSREELVLLIDDLQAASPPRSLVRETSVEESQSEATTPMVLSEAPTPVDSKAATPVTSGRTSPVLDTGQPRDKLKCDSIKIEEINESEIKKICLQSASDSKDSSRVDKGGTCLEADVKEDNKKTLNESKCAKINERKNSSEKGGSFTEKLHESSAIENIPEGRHKKGFDLLGDASRKEVVKPVKDVKLSKTEPIHDSVPSKRESEKMSKNIIVSSSKDKIEKSDQVSPITLKDLGQQLKEIVPEKVMLATGHKKSSGTMKELSKQISIPLSEQENNSLIHSTQDVHTEISNQDIHKTCKKQGEYSIGKESVSSVKNTLDQLSKIHILEPSHSDKSEAPITSSKDLKAACKDNNTLTKNLPGQLFDKKSMNASPVSGLPTAAKLQDVGTIEAKKKPVPEQIQNQDRKTIFRSLPTSCSSSEVAQDLSMHSVSQDTALNLSDTKDNLKFIERKVSSEKRNYFPKKDTIKELEKEKIALSVDAVLLSPHPHSQQKGNVIQAETSQRDSNVALNLTSPRKIFNIDKTKLEKESQQLIQDKSVGQGKDKPEKKTIDQIFSLSKSKHLDHIVTSGSDYVANAKKESQKTHFSSKVVDLSATKPRSLLAKSTKLETPTDLSKFAHMPLKSSSILPIKSDVESKRGTANAAEQKKISSTMQSSDLSRISDTSNIDEIKSSKSDSVESKSEETCASTKRIPKQDDDTMNHEKIVPVATAGKKPTKSGGIILEKEKAEPVLHSSIAPCKSSEEPKAGSVISMKSEIRQLDSDTRIVKPESHENKDKQLKLDKVSSIGPSQLDTVSLDPKSLMEMESAVSTDNIESKFIVNQKLPQLKNLLTKDPLKTDMVIIKKIEESTTTSPVIDESNITSRSNSTVDKKPLKAGSESKTFIKSHKKPTIPVLAASKEPIAHVSVSNKEPTLSVSDSSKEPTLPVSVESKKTVTPMSATSKQSITSGVIASKELTTSVSVVSKKPTTHVSVATKDPTTPVSVVSKEPTMPASVVSKEPSTPVSVASKKPTLSVSVSSKDLTLPLSSESKEPITPVSATSKERITPETIASKQSIIPVVIASKEPTTLVSISSKEPLLPVSVEGKDPITPMSAKDKEHNSHVSIAGKQSITPVSVIRKEPTIPVSIVSKEPTTHASVSSKEPTTPVSVISKKPTIPLSVASKEATMHASVVSKEPTTPVSVASKEPTLSVSVASKEPTLPVSVEIKEPITPVSATSKERITPEPIASKQSIIPVVIEGKEPTTPVSVVSQKPTIPVSVVSKESLTLASVSSKEPLLSVSVESKDPITPMSATSKEHITHVSIASKHSITPVSVIKKEHTTPVSVVSKKPTIPVSMESKELTKPISVVSKVPTLPVSVSSKVPSLSVSFESKELITPVSATIKEHITSMSIESKQPTTPVSVVSKKPTIPVSKESKELTTHISVVIKDPASPVSVSRKEPTLPVSVSSKEPSLPVSVERKESITPVSSTSKDHITPVSIASKQSVTPALVESKETTTPVSVPSKKLPIPVSVASKEPTAAVSVVSKEPTTPVSVSSKEPTIPVSVSSKDLTLPVSVSSKEPITSVSVARKEPITPKPIASKQSITPVSIASKELITPESIASKQPITPVSVESKMPTKAIAKIETAKSSSLTKVELVKSVSISEPSSSMPSGNMKLATSLLVEMKEPPKSLVVASKEPTKLSIERVEPSSTLSIESKESQKTLIVKSLMPSTNSSQNEVEEPKKSSSSEILKSNKAECEESNKPLYTESAEPVKFLSTECKPSNTTNVENKEFSKSSSIAKEGLSRSLPFKSKDCAELTSVTSKEASKSVSVLTSVMAKPFCDDIKEPSKSVAVATKELMKPVIVSSQLTSESDVEAVPDKIGGKPVAIPVTSNKYCKSESTSSCKSDTSNITVPGSKLITTHNVMQVTSAGKEGNKAVIRSNKFLCKSSQVICDESVKPETNASNDISKNSTETSDKCELKLSATITSKETNTEACKVESVAQKSMKKSSACVNKDTKTSVTRAAEESTIPFPVTVACKETTKSSSDTQNEEIKSEISKELPKNLTVETKAISEEISSKLLTSQKLNKSRMIPHEVYKDDSNKVNDKKESTAKPKLAPKETTNSVAEVKPELNEQQDLASKLITSLCQNSSKLGSLENKASANSGLKPKHDPSSKLIKDESIAKNLSCKLNPSADVPDEVEKSTFFELGQCGEVKYKLNLSSDKSIAESILVEDIKSEAMLSKKSIDPKVVVSDLVENVKKDKFKESYEDKLHSSKALDKSASGSSIGRGNSPFSTAKDNKSEAVKSIATIPSETHVDTDLIKSGSSVNSKAFHIQSVASKGNISSELCNVAEHCKFSATKAVCQETTTNKCDFAGTGIDNKPESLLKNSNVTESVSCPPTDCQNKSVDKDVVSDPVDFKDVSIDIKESDSKGQDQESEVGETIEETLMIVTGDGEGALCEGGNYFIDSDVINGNLKKDSNDIVDKNNLKCNCTYYRELADLYINDILPSASAIPWWENFELSCSEQSTNNVEVIEEKVQYFWGDGSGADCDAGNSGDEKESTVISTRSTRRNTRSAIKKQEIVETTIGDTSNESKLNGVKNNCQQNDVAVSSKVDLNSTSPDVQNVEDKSYVKSKGVATDNFKLIKENEKHGEDTVTMDSKEYVKSYNECENSLDKIDSKEIPEKNISETVISNKDENKEKAEVCKNQGLSKKKTEVDQSVSTCDYQELKCDDKEIQEENVAEKTSTQRVGFRGRGRPKKARRRGVTKRGRSASNDENKDEIEDSSEDEDGKKSQLRGKGRSDFSAYDEGPSHRQRSARIAKIREREETERRELEAQRMRQMAEEHRLRELKKKARLERRALREIKKTKKEKKKDKKKKKKKKKIKKKVPTGTDPWNHSSSSSSSSSEEDELEMEEEDNEELVFKSDHEFSPESDIGEEDAQPIKRARTARKTDIMAKEAIVSEEDSDYDDTQCVKCGHEDHPETILLCDSCDNGWHISCLRPPLFSVPEGDWSCPTCEHALLINKLKEILDHYDATKKKAETEELRKQRLAYINVSLDNVIPDKKKKHKHEEEGSDSDSDESDSDSESGSESSSSTGADSDSSSPALYTLRARPSRTPKEQVENFDELINEAIRDEMEAALMSKKTPVCRGKDISTIVEGEKEDVYEDEEEEEEKEEDEEVGKGTGKEMRIEEEENERMRKNEIKTEENKEIKLPKEEVKEELPKLSEEEVVTPKKEVRIAEDDDEEVAPKRKKKKLNDDEEADEKDAGSEYEVSEPETPPSHNKKKRMGNKAMMASKKRRRLTDLDVEEDEDDSDEDFMGTSEEDEEEEDASDAASSDFESESESDDSGGGRGRSGRYGIVPLRRSTRNTRNASMEDYDSDDKKSKRQKKKKKKKRKFSSSDEEDDSSDSEGSYAKKRKVPRKRSVSSRRSKGSKKSSSKKKKGSSRKPQNKKRKVEEEGEEGEEGEEKPKPKPRIKYSKPPKTKEEQAEEVSQRRVTRGRQINYYNSLLMSDEEFEDEEEKPKSRGKVMKGERVSESSSEFEISDDERKKRRGVSGGLGRGKVMKGEEEDEDEDYGKKKKKSEESPPLRGKPKSAILPPKLHVEPADPQKPIPTNLENVTSETPQKISSEEKCLTPLNPILIKGPPIINQAPIRMTVNRPGALPTPTLIRGGGPGSRPRHPTPLQSHLEAKMYNRPAAPGSRFPHASQIQIATSPTPIVSGISSSVSITPVSYVPNPNAPHAQSHIRPNNSVTMTPRGPLPRGPRPQISMPTSIPSHVTITRGPRGPPPAPNITATTGRISPPVTASRGPTSLPSSTNGNRLPPTTSVSKVEIKSSSTLPHPLALVSSASLPIIPAQSTADIPAERQALPVIATSAKKGGPLGRVSPGPLPSIGKWSPHITGGNCGSNTPPHHGLASGTPPHPNVGGAINSSPPPPYRLSPIPVSISGTGPPNVITHRSTPPNMSPVSVHSTGYPPPSAITHRSTPPNISSTSTHSTGYPSSTIAHRSTPPSLPPTTVHPSSYPPPSTISHRSTPPNLPPATTHPSGYPPYPPPEHFGPHPGYPPGYHPGAALSPGPHGPPPRHNLPHPGSINAGHPMYGPPVSHASSYQNLPPHHPGILRGPIHELYRHSPPGHPRPLVLKQGYPGLEPLPYAGSPGPIDVSSGRHSSPGPPITSKEPQAPPNKKPASNEGEFSSGLMSYFSSQREDDVE